MRNSVIAGVTLVAVAALPFAAIAAARHHHKAHQAADHQAIRAADAARPSEPPATARAPADTWGGNLNTVTVESCPTRAINGL